MPDAASRSPKGEQTRAAIVSAALRLFRAGGYDRTTMRAIADEAGVSLGNAYYYFGSKEHLVQAFYDQVQVEHASAAERVLTRETAFGDRLAGLFDAWLEVAAPYHEFAGKFFKNAAEPSSPLSPFSAESAPARAASVGLFQAAVDGSDLTLSPSLRAELPGLLWLMHMGVVLFWVHDSSPGQSRTRTLVDGAVPLADRLTRMTRLPIVRGIVEDVVDLVRATRG